MRRLLASALAVLAASALTLAQSGSYGSGGDSNTKSQVMKMQNALREATLKGDGKVHQEWLADDYHAVRGNDGGMLDKKTTVDNLNSGKAKYQQINISNEEVQLYGNDLAIAHGIADVKGTMEGKDISGKYHFARTWAKRNGKWQAVWFQTTKVPDSMQASK